MRFFVETPIAGRQARLVGGEAHHAVHVMRLRAGDRVVLFDGQGAEFTAGVTAVGRQDVLLEIFERCEVDRELPTSFSLGVALPKGDRQRWLVEKLVELGVTRLVPLITARGVAQPGPRAEQRLQRAVIEAAKQCGRNRLMQVGEPRPLPDFLLSASAGATRWMAAFEGDPLYHSQSASAEVFCAVGPEGGFTDAETAAGREAGWQLVSLGPRTLRVETAAVALAAHFSLECNSRVTS